MTYSTKEKQREYHKKYYQLNKEEISKYNEKNKEKKREYDRKWNEENKEYKRKWNEENKEKKREYNKKWYQLNKEKKSECSKKWREENKEKIAEWSRKWYEKNKEKRAEYIKERRAYCREYLGGKCVKCGTTHNLQFDHIKREGKKYEISSRLSNNLNNLKEELDKCQLLCAPCHLDKTAKEWEDMYN